MLLEETHKAVPHRVAQSMVHRLVSAFRELGEGRGLFLLFENLFSSLKIASLGFSVLVEVGSSLVKEVDVGLGGGVIKGTGLILVRLGGDLWVVGG